MTKPYFYIIQHKETGKKYAGSRWKKGCNPSEFMTDGGYCTSSPLVHEMIEKDGLSVFVIIEITEMDDPYAHETQFLRDNDCAHSDEWINTHNNDGAAWGTKYFKSKAKETLIEKYGVENPSQLPEVKEKKRQTALKNYGIENHVNAPEVIEKMIATNLDKYGVEYHISAPEVRQKSKSTTLKNYGVENPFQAEEIKKQIKLSNLEKYGVEHVLQSPELKAKQENTCMEKYGVKHFSNFPFLSVIETKKTYSKATASRWLPELRGYF